MTVPPAVPRRCEVHRIHRPEPLMLHNHHVQPAAMGGADDASNRVTVCPTGHFNIHAILASLVFATPRPKGTRTEKAIAAAGYRSWLAAGKPGNPHAAYGHAHPDPTP